jgi:uncharacterized membrane protein YkoI
MKHIFSKQRILLFLFCFFPYIATAEEKAKIEPSQKYQCQLISRGEAIKQAKSRMQGKVVGVQLTERNNRSTYRVRILVDKKRIKTISIQACR